MELKKNPNLNLEKKRGIFFQIGLILSLSMVLVAFEWTSVFEIRKINKTPFNINESELIDVAIERLKLPEPPKPKEVMFNKESPPKIAEIIINSVEKINEEKTVEEKKLTFSISPVGFANDSIDGPEPPYVFGAEIMPSFKGGETEMFKYLSNNLKYPRICLETGINGTVYLEFIIEKDGSITEVEVLRGVHSLLDKEAIRVVKSMPKWMPGRQRERNVSVKMSLPVKFTIKK